jgi:hypothetical protein
MYKATSGLMILTKQMINAAIPAKTMVGGNLATIIEKIKLKIKSNRKRAIPLEFMG